MITLRGVGVFIFSALLTGSPAYSAVSPSEATPKCAPPGKPATTTCYYKLTIKIIDPKKWEVSGTVPQSVVKHHHEKCLKNPKLDPKRNCPDPTQYKSQEYTFTIEGGVPPSMDLKEPIELESIPKTDRLKIRVRTQ